MIELFSKGDLRATLDNLIGVISKEIMKLSDEDIISLCLEEWTDYFVNKYSIEPIEIYLSHINKELSKTQIKKYNHFYRNDGYEPQYYLIDGYKITFSIPFNGEEDLLYLRPSKYYMNRFFIDSIDSPRNTSTGVIKLSLEYTDKEIREIENLEEWVDEKFKIKFKNYNDTIDNISEEINQFNKSLGNSIKNNLITRKKETEDYISISKKLNIPLKIDPEAPNTIPIVMKKKKKHGQRPTPTVSELRQKEEYEISEKDYTNIKNIINLACVSMERTAKTFIKFNEEELRDVILSNLNTHYEGTATGEAFSKVGKTDIRIQFDNKAAYIGECKIWHGEKQLNEALIQLFSYATWRDSKTSLIIFNKNNKDFNKLLQIIDKALDNNENCSNKIRTSKNKWDCIFLKSDDCTERINVQIVVYDLFC